jgi:cathepsin F
MRKVISFIAVALATCTLNLSDKKENYINRKFNEHAEKHNLTFSTNEERDARFRVFASNYLKMEKASINNDDATYTLGFNKFSTIGPKEFKRTYANLKISVSDYANKTVKTGIKVKGAAPESFDWREKGAIGPVKDQGSCGSCWAFSAVGNLEALYHIRDGKHETISEQELVDCDKVDDGCHGGLMENAFSYAENSKGIMREVHYPYTGRHLNCKSTDKVKYGQVNRHHKFEQVTEEQLKELIYNHGPMTIAINADPLQSYEGGIINDNAEECDPDALDHGVLVVGYTPEAWIIRNSWGKNWGENGYFRLARGQNTCGVLNYVASAVLPDA